MAGRLTNAAGALLAAAILLGTVAYCAGWAPPYPLNLALFQAALALSLGLALALGRA